MSDELTYINSFFGKHYLGLKRLGVIGDKNLDTTPSHLFLVSLLLGLGSRYLIVYKGEPGKLHCFVREKVKSLIVPAVGIYATECFFSKAKDLFDEALFPGCTWEKMSIAFSKVIDALLVLGGGAETLLDVALVLRRNEERLARKAPVVPILSFSLWETSCLVNLLAQVGCLEESGLHLVRDVDSALGYL